MPSTSDIAKRYFAALADHDLDAATACWKHGAIDRLVGAQELVAPGGPRIPDVAFDADVQQARASIRKLAALGPEVAWAGHADPVTGDVRAQLERAAEAPV